MTRGITAIIGSVLGVVAGYFIGMVLSILLFAGQGMGPVAAGAFFGAVVGGLKPLIWVLQGGGIGWITKAIKIVAQGSASVLRQMGMWVVAGFILAYGFTMICFWTIDPETITSVGVSSVTGVVVGSGLLIGLMLWHRIHPFLYRNAMLGGALGIALNPAFLYAGLDLRSTIVGILLGFTIGMAVQGLWHKVGNEAYGKIAMGLFVVLMGMLAYSAGRTLFGESFATNMFSHFPPFTSMILLGTLPLVGIPALMGGVSWLEGRRKAMMGRMGTTP
jgi:hypothetical protein